MLYYSMSSRTIGFFGQMTLRDRTEGDEDRVDDLAGPGDSVRVMSLAGFPSKWCGELGAIKTAAAPAERSGEALARFRSP
jgi:hypothetical protein